MTADSVEAQTIELVARVAGVKPEEVLLTNRLLHDLGIDGDDAVELFDGVQERFGTDLAHLHERWSEHFGPEGIPLSAGLIIIPAAVAGGFVAAPVGKVAGDIAAAIAGVAAAIGLIAASIWLARKLRLMKSVTPVTVAQVVRAVEAGMWPRPAQ